MDYACILCVGPGPDGFLDVTCSVCKATWRATERPVICPVCAGEGLKREKPMESVIEQLHNRSMVRYIERMVAGLEAAMVRQCYTCRHQVPNDYVCQVYGCWEYSAWEPKEEQVSHQSHRLEDFLGDFIRYEHNGREAIYTCRKCGTENLSVNTENGLWQCWCGCGSGREQNEYAVHLRQQYRHTAYGVRADGTVGVIDTSLLKAANAARVLSCGEGPRSSVAQGKTFSLIEMLYCLRHLDYPNGHTVELATAPANVFVLQGKLCMALLGLGREMIGWQTYEGKGQYRITGQRGIAQLGLCKSDAPIVLTEGFWDALSIQRSLPGACILCSAGASLSEQQLSILVNAFPGKRVLWLAFDNDYFGMVSTAHSQLQPYFDVRIALPPKRVLGSTAHPSSYIGRVLRQIIPVKDWDDIYAAVGPARTRALLREAVGDTDA